MSAPPSENRSQNNWPVNFLALGQQGKPVQSCASALAFGVLVLPAPLSYRRFQLLGSRVHQHREYLELTQAQLGEAATCTGPSSARSNAASNVSILNLKTIARALRVSLSELVAEGEGETE